MELNKILIILTAILLVSCGEAKHNSTGLDTTQGIKGKEFITFNDIRPLLVQK
mgnify:CR=1 FL=1